MFLLISLQPEREGGRERRDLHVLSSGGDTGHFASCVHEPHAV